MTEPHQQRGFSPYRVVLSNGFTLLAKENPMSPAVVAALSLPAGPAAERNGERGLSHFVARLLERGTARRSAQAIAESIDERGAALDTDVDQETVELTLETLLEDLPRLLPLLAELMREPSFREEEIERVRGEILTQLREDQDDTQAVAEDTVRALLYPSGHPYGRKVEGDEASVRSFNRGDLHGFHEQAYGPRGAILAVAGGVEAERVEVLVSDCLGDWEGRGGMDLTVATPPGGGAIRRRAYRMPRKSQVDLALAFLGLPRSDPQYYSALVMNYILGQSGLGGRLGHNVRDRQGLAYYCYSRLETGRGPAPLMIRAGVAREDVDRALSAITEEVRRMAQDGATAEELKQAKAYLIGSLPRAAETNHGLTHLLILQERYGLGDDYLRDFPDLIGAVELEDVAEAANQLLALDSYALALAGPVEA